MRVKHKMAVFAGVLACALTISTAQATNPPKMKMTTASPGRHRNAGQDRHPFGHSESSSTVFLTMPQSKSFTTILTSSVPCRPTCSVWRR